LAWKVELTDTAAKQLASLDKAQAQRITKSLRRLMLLEDPKCVGKTLTGNMRICLRYRTGDSRLIYELKNNCLIVVAVMVSGCK